MSRDGAPAWYKEDALTAQRLLTACVDAEREIDERPGNAALLAEARKVVDAAVVLEWRARKAYNDEVLAAAARRKTVQDEAICARARRKDKSR